MSMPRSISGFALTTNLLVRLLTNKNSRTNIQLTQQTPQNGLGKATLVTAQLQAVLRSLTT